MLYSFSYGMASASARKSRLAKAVSVRKWNWKYCKDSYMNAINKLCSIISHASKPGQHMSQYWLFSRIEWHLYYKPTIMVHDTIICIRSEAWVMESGEPCHPHPVSVQYKRSQYSNRAVTYSNRTVMIVTISAKTHIAHTTSIFFLSITYSI